MDDFDRINALPKDAKFNNWSKFKIYKNTSQFCLNQHLVVFRNTK